MKFPLFLYYELLIRLCIFRPEIGTFSSAFPFGDHVELKTDKGVIDISLKIMKMQFEDPSGDFAKSVHQFSFQTVHPAFYHPVLMES
jgi:hypothetical protein